MPMKIDVAELAGIVCEGVLYGLFVALFAVSLYVLLQKRRVGKNNTPFVVAALVMLGLATAQLVVDTSNLFQAFIPHDRAGRLAFLLDDTQPIFAAKHAIYFTMMLVGDSIVIYRAFIVWGRNYWVIIIPTLCSLGSAVSAYQTIWAVCHTSTASTRSETGWGMAIFSLSLSANALSTGLIAFRLWIHARRMSAIGSATLATSVGPVVWIVVESGAINAAYLLAYAIVLRSESNGVQVMASIATPMIGIIFSGVIIRAALVSDGARFGHGGEQSTVAMTSFKARVNISTTLTRTTDTGTERGEYISNEELPMKAPPV